MKAIILSIILFASVNALAQDNASNQAIVEKEIVSLKTSIQVIQNENAKILKEIKILKKDMISANNTIDSLKKQIIMNSEAIAKSTDNLTVKINDSGKSATEGIERVSNNISKNSLYGVIGLLIALLVTGVLYLVLGKRQKNDKTDIIDKLNKTKTSIEENLVKELVKQTELLETQIHLLDVQVKIESSKPTNQEIDHSLALKVADEITLIERNLSLMDKEVKGLKQLSKSVQKLKDNLNANGYEIPELIGKQYHHGMKVIVVSSVPDENIEKDLELISKVIKPQVNFKNKMIQTAQIEVSVGQ